MFLILAALVAGLIFFRSRFWPVLASPTWVMGYLYWRSPFYRRPDVGCSRIAILSSIRCRKLFKHSPELARLLETMGMIDEILSFHRYSRAFGEKMTPRK